MNGQNPQLRGNTTRITFKNTDNLKENPDGLIDVLKNMSLNFNLTKVH